MNDIYSLALDMKTLASLTRGQVYVKARYTVESRLEGRREAYPNVIIKYSGVTRSIAGDNHKGLGRPKAELSRAPASVYQTP